MQDRKKELEIMQEIIKSNKELIHDNINKLKEIYNQSIQLDKKNEYAPLRLLSERKRVGERTNDEKVLALMDWARKNEKTNPSLAKIVETLDNAFLVKQKATAEYVQRLKEEYDLLDPFVSGEDRRKLEEIIRSEGGRLREGFVYSIFKKPVEKKEFVPNEKLANMQAMYVLMQKYEHIEELIKFLRREHAKTPRILEEKLIILEDTLNYYLSPIKLKRANLIKQKQEKTVEYLQNQQHLEYLLASIPLVQNTLEELHKRHKTKEEEKSGKIPDHEEKEIDDAEEKENAKIDEMDELIGIYVKTEPLLEFLKNTYNKTPDIWADKLNTLKKIFEYEAENHANDKDFEWISEAIKLVQKDIDDIERAQQSQPKVGP